MNNFNNMLCLRILKQCPKTSYRLFSTSAVLCREPPYRTVDEVLEYKGPKYRIYPHKVLAKLLFKSKTKTQFSRAPPVGLPSIPIQIAAQFATPASVPSSKRVLVLNKHFMRYIPEVLATSELGVKLYGYDIQISHVKVNQDYKRIKVFWIPKGTAIDDEVEKLLKEIAEPLRKEMMTLRVMGIVPPLSFHKDKFFALMAEVDRRLKIADFGENFVPTVFTEDILRKQLQLQTTLPTEVKRQIFELEGEEPVDDSEREEIPPMQMNLFNLNFEKIQSTIANGMKRKRIADLSTVDEKTLLGDCAVKEVSFSVDALKNETWSKREFANYFRKIKIEKRKMLKNEAKEFNREILLESISSDNNSNQEEDELYNEFIKTAFEDSIEDDEENRVEYEQ